MISSVFDISGKTAIITGGGTGIGRGIALEFAKAGVNVAIASRSVEHLEPVAKEIRALGRRVLIIPTDVRKEEMVQNMVAKTIEEFGHIDILVNNSGGVFLSGIEDMSLRGWNAVVEIMLTGTYLCSRYVGKHMIERKSGNIINIASVAGLGAFPKQAHYGAAKAGIINFTKSLATEWGKYNIRVNAIAPGPIFTEAAVKPFADQFGITDREEMMKQWGRGCALGRCGTPEEIAYPAVFLASDASRFISGATLIVDGCHELEATSYISRGGY